MTHSRARTKWGRTAPLAALTLIGGLSAAAEPAKDGDGFVSLFNGKDLSGWVVSQCTAEVQDGSLVILEGNGYLRSEMVYGDFVLEMDWKNRKPEKYDSGIFIRANYPAKNKRWPDKYQVNLLQGQECSLVGNKAAVTNGTAKPGEWNHVKLTVTGTNAECELNGKPNWKVTDIANPTGFVGIQVEVPGGGQFEFKNIRIKAITPPQPAPATQPAK